MLKHVKKLNVVVLSLIIVAALAVASHVSAKKARPVMTNQVQMNIS